MKLFYALILSVLIIFNACNTNSDKEKELFESAQKNINDKKYKEAAAALDNLITEDPDGKYASLALLESAKLYQNSLVPGIPRPESISKAIKNYKLVFNNFPQDSTAEIALFLTGFIFSNDFNQFDSARTYYNMFLQKYPHSKFTNSVKLELENLGLTPDQILEKKIQSSKK